eukprot:97857-Hanusia_phi.AAC.1
MRNDQSQRQPSGQVGTVSLRTVNCPYTGQTFTADSGFVTSGYTNYADNSDCTWIIAPQGASNVTLTFDLFQLETGYDYVSLYSCTSIDCSYPYWLADLTGYLDEIDQPVTSPTGIMQVVFTSDESVDWRGFCATWGEGTACPSNPEPPVVTEIKQFSVSPLNDDYEAVTIAEVEV